MTHHPRIRIFLIATLLTLIAAPAAANWRGYNPNYGKGASFSKGTMIRNGSGASPRYYPGGRGVTSPKKPATTKVYTPKVLQVGNHRLLVQRSQLRSQRHLTINRALTLRGKNAAVVARGTSYQTVTQLVEQLGGQVTSSRSSNGILSRVSFTAPAGSALARLAGVVERVNQRNQLVPIPRRIKASGNPLYTSTRSNAEHAARANQPGFKDGHVNTRAGYLRNYGHSGQWGHGRYRVR